MTYIPDARRYQQLRLGGPTGPYDCTAWTAAWLADAHSEGKVRLTGRQIRLASNEPVPDRDSPGLNLSQVDRALRKLTSPDIDLDTRTGIDQAEAQRMVLAGHWMGLQVNRGVLVDRGFAGENRFRGGHALTVHAEGNVPVIGDPLVPYYIRASWRAVWAAAEALVLTPGGLTVGDLPGDRAYATFTRDVTREYRVSIHPKPPAKRQAYWVYRVKDDEIIGRVASATRGFSAACTQAREYPWRGHPPKSLVRIKDGSAAGRWVASGWSKEIP